MNCITTFGNLIRIGTIEQVVIDEVTCQNKNCLYLPSLPISKRYIFSFIFQNIWAGKWNFKSLNFPTRNF